MKILYIAFACDPYAGSEAQCGWSWPMAMRKYAEVAIVTRKENKDSIEKYMTEHSIKNIKVYYFDIPDAINIYYKKGKLYSLYYILWLRLSYGFIKELNNNEKFDYIHHVTLGDFRWISSACKLQTRFIFGPVGGGQVTPESLRLYAKTDFRDEKIREIINKLIAKWIPYRHFLNKTYLAFAANKETLKYLEECIADRKKYHLLTENGFNQMPTVPTRPNRSKVTLMWSGRMVKRKGLRFLIDVLKEVKTEIPYKLLLVGDGPEKKTLERIADECGLADKIEFIGKVPYTEMEWLYLNSDIFVFPSLRETTGTVLFEAMAYALPIITFNQNGAALLIDDTCGCKVNVDQPISAIRQEFAEYITELIDDYVLRTKLGEAACRKIRDEYLWDNKCDKFYNTFLRKD